ncbi:MAG: GntR family transcriptional regulator [Hyphomicrobiaceae bacterium]
MDTTLSRASLSEQIKQRLLDRILDGTLRPGDRIVELRIAMEMATSQAPVREALRELEGVGVVETLRNRGARVRVITNHELREIYDVRAQLEGYATEVAASRRASLKTRLMTLVRNMRQAARDADPIAFANNNSAFHRAIVEGAGNAYLLQLWGILDVKVRTMVNVSRQRRDLASIAESHLAIVQAIAAGDSYGAREAAEAHVLENKPEEIS